MNNPALNDQMVKWLGKINGAMEDSLRVETPNLYLSSSESLAGKPLESAICSHLEWRDRLDHLFDHHSEERLDPGVVGQDSLCAIGRWLNGPDSARYSALPAFAHLREQHARFHQLVGDIVRQAQGGDREGARKRLSEAEYTDTSWSVVNAISDLAKAVAK
jgi:hypothetical protein